MQQALFLRSRVEETEIFCLSCRNTMLNRKTFRERDHDFWLRWLKKFESLRCLWDMDERRHKNKNELYKAYYELAEFAKEIHPYADIHFVKSKINSFRASYRRERRKVKIAKRNGQEYNPTLFYFNQMKFLNAAENFHDDSQYGDDNSQEGEGDEYEKDPFGDVCNSLDIFQENSETLPEKRIFQSNCSTKKYKQKCDKVLEKSSPILKNLETEQDEQDEFEIFGKRIAAHFRCMDTEQWLIAEKLISEVCVYGRLKSLSIQTSINFDTLNKRD